MVSAVSSFSRAPMEWRSEREVPIPDSSIEEPTSLLSVRNAVKVVAGVLLFAGALAGSGRLLQLGGTQAVAHFPALESAGRAALLAGDRLLLAGKGIFLSVSVPVYTVTWAVPKWVATQGAPKAAAFTYRYVFIPVYKKLLKASLLFNQAMVQAAQAIYALALAPLGSMAAAAGGRIWNAALLPSLNAALRLIQAIQQKVLEPLALAMAQVWRMIAPRLGACKKALQAMGEKVLKPLGEALMKTLQWVWSIVLVRALDLVTQIIQIAFTRCLKPFLLLLANTLKSALRALLPLYELTEKAAFIFYHTLLAPACHATHLAAKWVWQDAFLPTVQSISQSSRALKTLLEKTLLELTYQTKIHFRM